MVVLINVTRIIQQKWPSSRFLIFISLLFLSAENNKQRCCLHQGKLQHARQSGTQQQGRSHDVIATSSSADIATAESKLESKKLRDLIESVPYYDHFVHPIQEMLPAGLVS